jgi:hypothetical protein
MPTEGKFPIKGLIDELSALPNVLVEALDEIMGIADDYRGSECADRVSEVAEDAVKGTREAAAPDVSPDALREMRDALEFYGDDANYELTRHDYAVGETQVLAVAEPVITDGGERARKALAALEGTANGHDQRDCMVDDLKLEVMRQGKQIQALASSNLDLRKKNENLNEALDTVMSAGLDGEVGRRDCNGHNERA